VATVLWLAGLLPRKWRRTTIDGMLFSHARSARVRIELTEHDDADAEQPTSKRFDVELFIVHSTVDLAEISVALGLDAGFAHRVADQRKTPAGNLLSGVHRDRRWRHSRRYETGDQWFADKVVDLILCLEPHKATSPVLDSLI
jgi:hypothetical protein